MTGLQPVGEPACLMGRPSKRRGYSRSCRNARRAISKKIAAITEMDSSRSTTRLRWPVRQADERGGVRPKALALSDKALVAGAMVLSGVSNQRTGGSWSNNFVLRGSSRARRASEGFTFDNGLPSLARRACCGTTPQSQVVRPLAPSRSRRTAFRRNGGKPRFVQSVGLS